MNNSAQGMIRISKLMKDQKKSFNLNFKLYNVIMCNKIYVKEERLCSENFNNVTHNIRAEQILF
jgi:hypothetical protein